MDCTDIKVLLSGLIDDELDGETRYAAERHLADCAACRAAVDEAEGLSQLVRAEAELTLMPESLPEGFVGAVFGRTVFEQQRRRSRGPGWMNMVGWLAAAASIMLAMTLWMMNRRPVAPMETAPVAWHTPGRSFVHEGSEPAAPDSGSLEEATGAPDEARVVTNVGAPGELFFSSVADEASPPAAALPLVTRDDAETIDAASWLLEMLLAADDRSFADIEQIRRIAEYDDLLRRLAEARDRLDPRDRPAVFAAESILLRIVNGPISLRDMQELRESVRRTDLPGQLAGITGRGDMILAL